MDNKETLKYLYKIVKETKDEEAYITLHTLVDVLTEYQDENKFLWELINELKCCGNCRYFNDSSNGYTCDIGSLEDCSKVDYCDNWHQEENK